MVEIKTPGEIQAMREAGKVVAQIQAAVRDQAQAGMRTAELDEIARDVLAEAGAVSGMHEEPHIPNEGPPGRGRRLVPGLVIAIEPWFLAGGEDACRIDGDGWTIRSGDGSRAAHAEHTVAVTADGPQLLTAP